MDSMAVSFSILPAIIFSSFDPLGTNWSSRFRFVVWLNLEDCAISEITMAELIFGAENSPNPKKNYKIIDYFSGQLKILPIFNSIHIYAKEKMRSRKTGIMISDFDLLIGSTAIANGLILITENVKECERIPGIEIENWYSDEAQLATMY
jgi:tRNA(fMet)-specific endonuclease VapC